MKSMNRIASSHVLGRAGLVLLVEHRRRAQGRHAAGPRPPRDEQAAFVLADPALTIELVAAEPEVTSPVAIAWDEDGRLYVAEMIDYPVAPAAGRIRRLEDRDGDGRYEHATVFADGLPFPNGVLPCFGGVLVTAAPNIWFFRDRDGDGRAEEKSIVLTGFGEGNTQLRVNGLAFGLDNMIYAANGRSDGEVRSPNDPPAKAVSIRRRDLRFRLAARPGSEARGDDRRGHRRLQPVRTGARRLGQPVPLVEHDPDPARRVRATRRSTATRTWPRRRAIASILDMADGGRIFSISPAQARFNRESVAFFNASCGPMIERGGLLPAAYHGNAFVCEPLSNLVHRRVLEPDGVTFVARRVEQGREFLASSDPAFRPVNLATGPDGALYIVDMYRELVEHPQFVPGVGARVCRLPALARSRADLASPSQGRGGIADRRKPRPGQADTRQLVGLLGHRNAWWRMTAQRLLVERQDRAAVPMLDRSARTTRPIPWRGCMPSGPWRL